MSFSPQYYTQAISEENWTKSQSVQYWQNTLRSWESQFILHVRRQFQFCIKVTIASSILLFILLHFGKNWRLSIDNILGQLWFMNLRIAYGKTFWKCKLGNTKGKLESDEFSFLNGTIGSFIRSIITFKNDRAAQRSKWH